MRKTKKSIQTYTIVSEGEYIVQLLKQRNLPLKVMQFFDNERLEHDRFSIILNAAI